MTTIYGPATVDFTGAWQIYQGATYDLVFTLTLGAGVLNLSAYGATPPRCQFRTPTFDAAGIFLTPVMSWVDPATAQMRIRIEASVSTAIVIGNVFKTSGVHDIEVVNGIDVLRVGTGKWDFIGEATR